MRGANSNLEAARRNKNDEFYTQLPDIEKELCHYTSLPHGTKAAKQYRETAKCCANIATE